MMCKDNEYIFKKLNICSQKFHFSSYTKINTILRKKSSYIMPKIIDYKILIKEGEEELEHMAKQQKNRQNTDRLRFLRYLKSEQAHSQIQAGELIGLKPRQSQNLWNLYAKGGINGLLITSKPRYLGKLSSIEISRVLQYSDSDQLVNQKQTAAFIKQEMGINYTQAGIHYLFKRLKVKNKTGRPSNIRKDEIGAEVFKKNT
jgi:transposase